MPLFQEGKILDLKLKKNNLNFKYALFVYTFFQIIKMWHFNVEKQNKVLSPVGRSME